MQIGDKVWMMPTAMVDEHNRPVKDKLSGTVIFVHPKRRFYTVEFDTRGGRIRESFRVEAAPNVGAMR